MRDQDPDVAWFLQLSSMILAGFFAGLATWFLSGGIGASFCIGIAVPFGIAAMAPGGTP